MTTSRPADLRRERLRGRLFPGAETTPYGVVHSVMLAQSIDYEHNVNASSGGILGVGRDPNAARVTRRDTTTTFR